MKKYVVYNEKGNERKELAIFKPGMRYEVESISFSEGCMYYTLKGFEGLFSEEYFEDENEINFKKNKPVYFAKAVAYYDMSSYIGSRFSLMKLVKEKFRMTVTTPIISVEYIYGNVYKIETEDVVYITAIAERTVR